jgi:excinuclease UvrABC nuclease subunit
MLNELKQLIKISKIKAFKFVPWDHVIPKEEIDILAAANKLGGGIYRMYDGDGNIIYVGKSNNVHRRLLEHIGERSNTAYFIDQVARIEWYSENNPILQTLLEGVFIAYHMPKYNDEVKDFHKMEENK